MISIKTENEIAIMREGGRKLAQVMVELEKKIVPGENTLAIDKLAEELVFNMGGKPAFKGYGAESGNPFPATICASINNEVVHGIPSEDVILKEGDILKVDIGMKYKGMFSDMARTFAVGKIDEKSQKIIDVVKKCLNKGIEKMKAGKKISDFSKTVQGHVESSGFSVVRNLVGHGIGKDLHESPQIPNYYNKDQQDFKLKAGMTFALEPMINAGESETILGKDGWVYKTKDSSLSAHWENTFLITEKGVEVLTQI